LDLRAAAVGTGAPELAGRIEGIDAGFLPPGGFITRAMDQSMMDATKRDQEFIRLPCGPSPRLGEAQVPPPFTSTNRKAAFVRIQQEPSVAAGNCVSFVFC
jgi:hypothetical protein